VASRSLRTLRTEAVGQAREGGGMSALTHTDLHHVLSRVPRDILAIVKEQHLFIAGGFIRSVIAGEQSADIDLFGVGKEALKLIALELASKRGGRFHETDNAFTVLSGHRLPVQFIHRWTYAPHEWNRLLGEFDFTIAKAVIWWVPGMNETEQDKWHSACDERFYSDLAAKRLHYTSPQRQEDAGGSLLRARKFLRNGYNIQANSLAAVVARLFVAVREKGDGRMDDEVWVAKILTALLREVDPLLVVDGVDLVDEHQTTEAAP
jgi:hypothetical protein